jgi:hypothetical protein
MDLEPRARQWDGRVRSNKAAWHVLSGCHLYWMERNSNEWKPRLWNICCLTITRPDAKKKKKSEGNSFLMDKQGWGPSDCSLVELDEPVR